MFFVPTCRATSAASLDSSNPLDRTATVNVGIGRPSTLLAIATTTDESTPPDK